MSSGSLHLPVGRGCLFGGKGGHAAGSVCTSQLQSCNPQSQRSVRNQIVLEPRALDERQTGFAHPWHENDGMASASLPSFGDVQRIPGCGLNTLAPPTRAEPMGAVVVWDARSKVSGSATTRQGGRARSEATTPAMHAVCDRRKSKAIPGRPACATCMRNPHTDLILCAMYALGRPRELKVGRIGRWLRLVWPVAVRPASRESPPPLRCVAQGSQPADEIWPPRLALHIAASCPAPWHNRIRRTGICAPCSTVPQPL